MNEALIIQEQKNIDRILFYFFSLGIVSAWLFCFRDCLIDDTYITLSYVKNLINHGTWGITPNFMANSATSPLNVILLTLISSVTQGYESAVVVLSALLICFTGFLSIRLSDIYFNTPAFGFPVTLLIAINPLLISTLGLESYLFITCLTACFYSYAVKNDYLLGISLGLLILARMDGIVLSFVFLLFTPGVKRKIIIATIIGAVITPWFIISWVYLGGLLPDTFFIKIGQRSWGYWSFYNGIGLYLNTYPLATSLSFISILALPCLFVRAVYQQSIIRLIAICLFTHYISYSVLHVPPYHWYYAPEVYLLILLSIFSLGFLYQFHSYKKIITLSSGFILSMAIAGILSIFYPKQFIMDEMPIHTNWALPKHYQYIGRSLTELIPENDNVDLQMEIGTLAFFSDRQLLDVFSDRQEFYKIAMSKLKRGGSKALIFSINTLFFNAPPTRIKRFHLSTHPPNQPHSVIQTYPLYSKWAGHQTLYLSKLD